MVFILHERYSIEVYSIIGEQIISTMDKQIDTQEWNSGIYFVVIKNELGLSVKSLRILKP